MDKQQTATTTQPPLPATPGQTPVPGPTLRSWQKPAFERIPMKQALANSSGTSSADVNLYS